MTPFNDIVLTLIAVSFVIMASAKPSHSHQEHHHHHHKEIKQDQGDFYIVDRLQSPVAFLDLGSNEMLVNKVYADNTKRYHNESRHYLVLNEAPTSVDISFTTLREITLDASVMLELWIEGKKEDAVRLEYNGLYTPCPWNRVDYHICAADKTHTLKDISVPAGIWKNVKTGITEVNVRLFLWLQTTEKFIEFEEDLFDISIYSVVL